MVNSGTSRLKSTVVVAYAAKMRSTDSVDPLKVVSARNIQCKAQRSVFVDAAAGELESVGLVERAALEGEDRATQPRHRAAGQHVSAVAELQLRVGTPTKSGTATSRSSITMRKPRHSASA